MLLLYDLQSPVNIGQILRTGEQFQFPITVYDPRGILADPDNTATLCDFSCGAFTRRPPVVITDYAAHRAQHRGRVIATCVNPNAMPLHDFSFQPDDIILLGNEYDGLPQPVIDDADIALYIPLPEAVLPKPPSFSSIDPTRNISVAQNGVPNLNVAMTASIISYAAHVQRNHAANTAVSGRRSPTPP